MTQDKAFRNAVIDNLILACQETKVFPTGLAHNVYTKLPPNCTLWRFLIDIWAWEGEERWIFEKRKLVAPDQNISFDVTKAPVQFWQDVVIGLWSARGGQCRGDKRPWEVDRCKYHEHADGERCEGSTAAP